MNYNSIKDLCKKNSAISEDLLDKFFLYFCAERENLQDIFFAFIKPYRHILQKMPENFENFLLSQFVIFRLFREDGYISKYMDLPEVTSRNPEELEYLNTVMTHPWRFTFSEILNRPEQDFFEMKDMFSHQEYLLYSPTLSQILDTEGPMPIVYLLIGNNSQCWQTYGPLYYFKGLIKEDLEYFAYCLRHKHTSANDIIRLIDHHPVLWTLLWSKGNMPPVYKDKHRMLQIQSELKKVEIPLENLKEFSILRKGKILKLSLDKYSVFPHFSEAYYHTKKKHLLVSAMTMFGYNKIIKAFSKIDISLPAKPDYCHTMTIEAIAQDILGEKAQTNPYSAHFATAENTEESAELDKINYFVSLFMEAHNNHERIDIEQFAEMAEIDINTAHDMVAQITRSINRPDE